MYLVDVGFLGGELNVFPNFFSNRTEEGIVDQRANYAVLVGLGGYVFFGVFFEGFFVR